MDEKTLEAFRKLKKWDKIYNITPDSFLELILKDLEIREIPRSYIWSDKKLINMFFKTEDWREVYQDSEYPCNDWFPTKEIAEEKREEIVNYHKNNIKNHTNELVKLLNNNNYG